MGSDGFLNEIAAVKFLHRNGVVECEGVELLSTEFLSSEGKEVIEFILEEHSRQGADGTQ
jgi:hypothetical protein